MPVTQDKADAANPQEGITIQQECPTEEIPNPDTLEAISKFEENGGTLFTDSTKDFFKMLMESDD